MRATGAVRKHRANTPSKISKLGWPLRRTITVTVLKVQALSYPVWGVDSGAAPLVAPDDREVDASS